MAQKFGGSARYWENRYRAGHNSGKGSYGELAEFKAEVLNAFVAENNVDSVVEFGCGDGNQLKLAVYPQYCGYDVSATAVAICRSAFSDDATKKFALVDEYKGEQADLAISLDVLFHLVEEEVFQAYMQRLFAAARRFVIIYSSNTGRPVESRSPHVRHRNFSSWVERYSPSFELIGTVENPYRGAHKTREGHSSPSDFFFYARRSTTSRPPHG